jgi:FkbM family methyltransferase
MSKSFNVTTVLGDQVIWDTSSLPLDIRNKEDGQLRRCRRTKQLEASNLLKVPLNSAFLDVGSHFGDTVITMALHARNNDREDIRFFAFEPSLAKVEFIRRTVLANALGDSVQVVQACVGEVCRGNMRRKEEKGVSKHGGDAIYEEGDDEKVIINGTDEDADSGSNSDASDDEGDEEGTIIMITLDSMADVLSPVGFMHVDVEGWESRVLSGASVLLSSTAATLLDNDPGCACCVLAEVWSGKHCLKRGASSCTPIADIVSVMAEHSHFRRGHDIVDQERNLFFSTASDLVLFRTAPEVRDVSVKAKEDTGADACDVVLAAK